MKFRTATAVSKVCLGMSISLCLIGLLFRGEMQYLQFYCSLAALIFLLGGFAVVIAFCKCPNCGKRIFFGANKVVYCPSCRRNIETGKKVSKKKARETMRK